MVHPLVEQLRFTRSEFQRALEGLSDEDAVKRVGPANCIAWNIGHLAWQEQRYWLIRGQDRMLRPDVNEQFAYGAAASTPPLAGAWAAWREITSASDAFLDELTTEKLQSSTARSKPLPTSWGNLLQRTIYHYWYHAGENMGIRQALGHSGLQDFVGDIDGRAPYRAE
ncbi:MAG: DinB family protein [Chloroflexota bacterium]|nr:DinB family protein [Chloroflexota bacterium]